MRIKALMASLCVLGLFSLPSFAAIESNDSVSKTDQILSKAETLQNGSATLPQKFALKQKEKKSKYKKRKHQHQVNETKKVQASASSSSVFNPLALPDSQQNKGRSNTDLLIQHYLQNLPVDWDNPGQSYVSMGPYVSVPIQFSGSNLIVNDPKINTDVALLKLRKAAHEDMVFKGIHTEEETHHSHLLLSGILEGQAQYTQYGQQGGLSGAGNNGSSSDLNLTTAELDGFLLSPSPWVSGFFSFAYRNGTDPIETNSRVLNSSLFLNNAFVILGDFTQSPFYGTLGQMYVPFGTYSSVFISSPLTKTLGRTKARAVLAGYQGQSKNAFYTALYAFKGDSHASATSRINNGGINLGYKFDLTSPNINGDIGIGWIGNIADSVGMQNTGGQPVFNGFAGPTPYGLEKIVHRVPALDLRGIISIGEHLDLIAEYVGVTTSFNPNDLRFNARGAKPWGLNTEAAYTFEIFNKPTSIGIGYSQVREALALGLPEKRCGAVLNTSIWHNTIQSLEFRHDINYVVSTVASGSGVLPMAKGLGTSDNVITVQFDLYF